MPKLRKQLKHSISVVVDRLVAKSSARRRLTDTVETALRLGGGVVVIDRVDVEQDDPQRQTTFSEHLACLDDGLSFEELEPRSFSFNSPFGACAECSGLGTRMEVDPELVIPDPGLSLADGALAPMASGSSAEYFQRLMNALAEELHFDMRTPWEDLGEDVQHVLLHGRGDQVVVKYRNRFGREREYSTGWEGVVPFVERRHANSESDAQRERFAGYMRDIPCPSCHGARLKPLSLAVTIGERNIAEIAAMPIADCAAFLEDLELDDREGADRSPGAQGGQRAAAVPHRRRPALLDAGPGRGNPGRR